MRRKQKNKCKFKYPKTVPIINGAPSALVGRRHLRNKYLTNQEIKYWSSFFLLKALTTSSFIRDWINQKEYLLTWLQMNENTFRRHLSWMKQNELAEVDKLTYSIRLCSYEAAAGVLGIEYEGTYDVEFDVEKHKAKQSFQYLLRTEEFEFEKNRQLTALMSKIDKNPSLKEDILYYLIQFGADYERLHADPAYYAKRLLLVQVKMFKEGSEIFEYIMRNVRADLNRSAKLIKSHHGYLSCQSVAYLKRKMEALGFANIGRYSIISKTRMRFYFPAQADTPAKKVRNGLEEGYKWVRGMKRTMWVLTDQISRAYKADSLLSNSKNLQNAA